MRKVEQDDSLLKEKKLILKQKDRVRSESERFRFENPGKKLVVRFSYFFTLKLRGSEKVGSVVLMFSKHVDKKGMEECIRDALAFL